MPIGNDIVDRQKAASVSNWQRKGYLDKLFLPKEQELILADEDPELMVWLLWTMKEASYKAVNRINGIRSFAPVNFYCHDLLREGSQITAIVSTETDTLFVKAEINAHLIYAEASLSKKILENLRVSFFENAIDYVALFNSVCAGKILLKTADGLPLVIDTVSGNALLASVSHHGRYTAITYTGSQQ